MKKARREGTTLSAVLNFAAQAYIKNHLRIALIDPEFARGLDDIAHGRVISLEEAEKRLRIRQNKH